MEYLKASPEIVSSFFKKPKAPGDSLSSLVKNFNQEVETNLNRDFNKVKKSFILVHCRK